jgi:hypothetical protein
LISTWRRAVLRLDILRLCCLCGLQLLISCGSVNQPIQVHLSPLSGVVYGGQQPISGSLVQLYAVGTTADGAAATPLISATVTTSDGSGNASNSNANAGNGFNSLPIGAFTITGDYQCPSASTQVYLVSTGGNPGLASGTNNPNIAIMAALGSCGNLTSSTYLYVNELTTVGSIAPLANFMSSYAAIGSSSSDAAALVAAMSEVSEYTNVGTGSVPGPTLPPGYYASSTEIITLGDIIANCVNTAGGVAGDGSYCGQLFTLATPPGGIAPTDTIGAILNILKNPTLNVCSIFYLIGPSEPFEPTLAACPATWTLPIVPVAATPSISPVSGAYSGAQVVTITDLTAAATIHYTTDGSTPTSLSNPYTSPFLVSSSSTVKAIATASGYENSGVASATYTITPTGVAAQLAFIAQPNDVATGITMTPAVTVAVEDSGGNIVTNATNPVTLAIATNPASGTLSGTLTATPSNGIATFSNLSIDNIANGYQLSATSTGLTPAVSQSFNVTPYPITIAAADPLVGVGSTLPGSFTLSQPAPAGGVTVMLTSSNTGIVTVSPAAITVAQGQTGGSFTYTGVAVGQATLTASASGYLAGTAQVTATNSLISLGQLTTVAPGQTSTIALNLGVTAPAGGVTVSLTSSNTAAATVTQSVFIPAGFKIGAINPQITGVAFGTTTITASAPGFSPDIRTVTVALTASFPASESIPLTAANPVTLTLSAPAAAGGLPFTLSSDNTSIASVPASIIVPAGSTSVSVPVTGVSFGSTTIRADSPGIAEATTNVKVQPSLGVGNVTTGAGLYVTDNISLGAVSSPPVTVTVTSSNPAVALLSASAASVGSASISFSNVTNTIPAFYVQGQAAGTASITVSAPGYNNGTGAVTVDPVGIVLSNGLSIATTTTSGATSFGLTTALLDPVSLAVVGYTGTPNPGTSAFSIPVTSSSPSVGTITTSPVVFAAGSVSAATSFTPAGVGTTTISLGTQPAGFTATSSSGYLSGTATVSLPATQGTSLNVGSPTTGVGVYVGSSASLSVIPAAPVNVTITSSNPAVALLSTSAGTVGSSSITFQNVNSTGSLVFYVQGESAGAATLTATAAGYNTGTGIVTVDPTGIIGSFTVNTTSFSTPTTLSLSDTLLDPRTLAVICPLSPQCFFPLNPGTGPLSVAVTSSDPFVGTITVSPVVFPAGSGGTAITAFQPINVGNTLLSLGAQPTGFSATSSAGSLSGTATVTGPNINVTVPTTGAGLYVTGTASFATNPPAPVTVTITSSNPAVALISANSGTVGSRSITLTNVSSIPAFYVQGQSAGTTTLTIAATGFNTATSTYTVDPSGIVLAYSNSLASINTTTFSAPTVVGVATAILDPTTLAFASPCYYYGCTYYPLNPGTGPLSIAVTSTNPSVGTMTVNPVVFPAGSSGYASTAFEPLTAGTTTLTLGAQPTGFTATSSGGAFLAVPAVVTAPALTVGNVLTGQGLFVGDTVSLPTTPPSPVTVTITSSNPGVALLSTSATTVGSASISFANITGSVPSFFVQGQSIGTAGITVTAPGFSNGSGTITVDPSGMIFYAGESSLNTTPTSSPTTLPISMTVLDPVTLDVVNCQIAPGYCPVYPLNPGTGPFSIAITSSNPTVGTITSPVVFPAGSSGLATASFTPLTVGTSTLSLGAQPAGFVATGSNGAYLSGTATVSTTAPQGPSIGSATTGVGVYTSDSASLGTAPASPITVTITSSNPAVALLSTNSSTVGSASITFSSVSGTNSLTFYVQGQSAGAVILTLSAPGYPNTTASVAVDPTGFLFASGSTINTTIYSPPTNVNVQTNLLDPVTLQAFCPYYPYTICPYPLNPGTGPFTLTVTSSVPSVGTITTSPVTFPAGSNGVATTSFQPVSAGSTVLALGIQPTGFTATSSSGSYLFVTANVNAPGINVGSVTTGASLYVSDSANLAVAPPSPVTVTLTSSNPAVALLSTNAATVGSASITFTNVSDISGLTFYVQGQNAGTATITASAAGYTSTTGTLTIDPSGFVFGNEGLSINTTTFSPATTVNVQTAILDPVTQTFVSPCGNGVCAYYPLNPGIGPLSIAVTSSNPNIGTITTSPVTFPAGSSGQATTTFQPANVGNSTIALGAQPTGFIATTSSAGLLTGTATVTGPNISVSSPTTGVGLYVTGSASLAVTPPSPVTVTITSSNPAIALLSASSSTTGSATITFTGVSGAVPTFYVQGQSQGTATLTVSAPGYNTVTSTITVDPVGIVFPGQLSINTTTFSTPTPITVSDALLNPVTLEVMTTGLPFNPGLGPVTIPISSTHTNIGTVAGPIVFPPGSSGSVTTTFQPINPGATTVYLGTQPTGFTTTLSTGSYLNGPATVTAPNITVASPTTGAGQYVASSSTLQATLPSPESVTITSSNPSVALLSTSATTAGSASITFTTSTSTPTYYVQGQAVGSATLTVSAQGFNNGTGTVTVDPSGIVFYNGSNTSTLATTTYAPATAMTLATAILDPSSLAVLNYNGQPNPGTTLSIPVTSSNPSIGTVTSPVVFSSGSNGRSATTFQPVAAGTTTIALGAQPSGYTATSSAGYLSGTATVTAPNVSVTSVTTGVGLYATSSVCLGATPPSAVTITLTSASPSVALLSTSASTVGSASISFSNVTTTACMTFYVQGQSVGTAAINVAATGYNGYATATVDPSGFGFASAPTFSTTTFSGNRTLTVYTLVLNPGSLTEYNYNLPLNPGTGPFTVPVTSSNTSAGTITASPVTFSAGGSSAQTAFQPVAAGTATIAIGAQPTGFSTPSAAANTQGTATVTAFAINVPSSQTTGVNLSDNGLLFSLSTAPPSGVTVTLTSSNPAVATLGLGATATAVGTAQISFTNLTTTANQSFNIQGQSAGTATISVSAPGYNTATFTVTVDPAGFGFTTAPTFTTSTISSNTTLTLTTLVLTPGTLTTVLSGLPLNPGAGTIAVPVTSSNTAVGTIVSGQAVFSAGGTTAQTAFQPVGAGTSTIAIGSEPSGFSTPSATASTQGTATVTTYGINVPANQSTSVSLTDGSLSVSLSAVPASAVTITLTSANPSVASLGTGATGGSAGTATITFTGVSTTAAQVFNIQGLVQGTSVITVSAPGYATATFNVTVGPYSTTTAYGETESLTFSVFNTAGAATAPTSVYGETESLTFSVLNTTGTATAPTSVYGEADGLTFSVLNTSGTTTTAPTSVYGETDSLTFSVLNTSGTTTTAPTSVYGEIDSLTFSVLNTSGTTTTAPSTVYGETESRTFSVQNTATGVAAHSVGSPQQSPPTRAPQPGSPATDQQHGAQGRRPAT